MRFNETERVAMAWGAHGARGQTGEAIGLDSHRLTKVDSVIMLNMRNIRRGKETSKPVTDVIGRGDEDPGITG